MSKEIKESGKIWAKNAIPYKNKNGNVQKRTKMTRFI